MITDYNTTVIAVSKALLGMVTNPTDAHKREATRRANGIMDLACQLLLEDGATLHNAERFASALIINSRDPISKELTVPRIASVLKNRVGKAYVKSYNSDDPAAVIIYERGMQKIAELVTAPLTVEPNASVQSAHRQGSITPAPNSPTRARP